ncbi:MAG TPA: transposase [Thermoanaerobaculia bacterium]|nr:transposase [Thermoanaerobaculia bacterium]
MIGGCLGRAQRVYGMRVHGCVFLSNHYHLLLSPDDPYQLAAFMNHFNSKLAREVARLHGWNERIWGHRYHAIPVSDEEAAQVEQLRYLLAQSCKEDLVEQPGEWPGVHCAEALRDGTALLGHWYDRTAEAVARHRGKRPEDLSFVHPEQVVFSPLPCWAHLPPDEYRQRIRESLVEITSRSAAERAWRGAKVLGAKRVLSLDPHTRPATVARRPAPWIHAATSAARTAFRLAYRLFVVAFREAARRLRAGRLPVSFPPWSFPPHLPRPTG